MNPNDIRVLFAKAVKTRRDRLGLSQEQLAERANLHRTYISDVERGTRNLSLGSIDKLARALEVSVAALFSSVKSHSKSNGSNGSHNGHQFVDILLVEDNRDDEELTLDAFAKARFTNHVHVARDGQAALDFLFGKGEHAGRNQEERPQIVLLDLNLPKIGGLEVLRRMRADKRTRDIPVVVLTVSQRDRDIAECRRLGIQSYIVKPVSFQGLSAVTPQLSLLWALLKPPVTMPA